MVTNKDMMEKYGRKLDYVNFPLRRIDPPGCDCRDCVKYEISIPLDKATYNQVIDMLSGRLENATGGYQYCTLRGAYDKNKKTILPSLIGNIFTHHHDDIVETFFTYPVGYIISHVDDIRYYGNHVSEDIVGFNDPFVDNDEYVEFSVRFTFDRKGEQEDIEFFHGDLSPDEEDIIVNEIFGPLKFW